MARAYKKVIVIGLDGFEPAIVDAMLASGELPTLARLRKLGGYRRLRTTFPAQTPVAWSTFATGVNPGGHGIFDFLRRNPRTYLPEPGLNTYAQTSVFLPPRVVNLRRGVTVWELLSSQGIPSAILRCPCTFPPENIRGQVLAGMGVPDLMGSFGTGTFYTTAENPQSRESEKVVAVRASGAGEITTQVFGPRNPRTRNHYTSNITLRPDPATGDVMLESEGRTAALVLRPGQWSEWLPVKFKTGILQTVRGMVRFYLVRTTPEFELYASPINFDPDAPLFAISSPSGFARELAGQIGLYYTTGMVEDHSGLSNGRFDEAAFLQQCEGVVREREKMMLYQLHRLREGLFFCLFDTPDRVQHMFWRFREKDHPANSDGESAEMTRVIEDHYRSCDTVVAKALEAADDQTLFIVLSDHGFGSFQRGINLNAWLHSSGLLVLKNARPDDEGAKFFRDVDWGRTRAYALGLGGIYLNRKGREEQGIVEEDEAASLKAAIAKGLTGLADSQRGTTAIRRVLASEQVYAGPFAHEAPDLIVNCAQGYRVSWDTALGGIGASCFEDNCKKWSGDHIIDPELAPGVLFMNRPFRTCEPGLVDLAPTILDALGASKSPVMEGGSLLL